jgi:hypothetical protein
MEFAFEKKSFHLHHSGAWTQKRSKSDTMVLVQIPDLLTELIKNPAS